MSVAYIRGVPFSIGSDDVETRYSTDEIMIGTWVDGRPIYRKVFLTKAPPSTNIGVIVPIAQITALNADFYIRMDAVLNYATSVAPVAIPNGTVVEFDTKNLFSIWLNGGGIQCVAAHQEYPNKSVIVILEYVKRT